MGNGTFAIKVYDLNVKGMPQTQKLAGSADFRKLDIPQWKGHSNTFWIKLVLAIQCLSPCAIGTTSP